MSTCKVGAVQELLARILLDSGTVPHLDQEALRWAAVTHDIQRKHDYEALLRNNQAHGIRAAEWVRGRFPRLYPHVSRETIEHIAYINYWHDVHQNAVISCIFCIEYYDWGKPSHYYTFTEGMPIVYSSGWACPSHAVKV